MKMILNSVILLMLMGSSCLGDDILQGPSEVAQGKSPVFKVKKTSVGSVPAWTVVQVGIPAKKGDEVSEVSWMAAENANEYFVIVLDVDYPVIVSVAAKSTVAEATTPLLSSKLTMIKGWAPPLPDNGDDDEDDGGDDKTPDKPTKYGLTNTINTLVATLPADQRAQVKLLAPGYKAVASRIAAGTLTTKDAVVAAQKEANLDALGGAANRDKWLPFFVAIAKNLQALETAGTLPNFSKDDYFAAWTELGKATENAK